MRALLLAIALLAPLEQMDLEVQRAVQASRAPWLEPVMRAASGVGRPANVLGALLAIALFDATAGRLRCWSHGRASTSTVTT